MDWTEIASKFGVPATFAAAILYGFWQACRWSAENAVKPIVQSHRDYLAATAKAALDASAAVRDTSSTLTDIKQESVNQTNLLKTLVNNQDKICRQSLGVQK